MFSLEHIRQGSCGCSFSKQDMRSGFHRYGNRLEVQQVEAGELDAGIVYASDIAASDAVEEIALPAATNVAITYPIATLTESPNQTAATAFVAFVLSAQGQAILRSYGFGAP